MNDLKDLEELYKRILNIVNREVGNIMEKEQLGPNEVKALEAYEKITRNGITLYSQKPKKDVYSDMDEESLLKELDH